MAAAISGDRALRGIHLIALTGYDQPEDQQRARGVGFETHITKPVDTSTIREVIASLPTE